MSLSLDDALRLAARAPGLDIFGQRLILRDSSGWQITPEGRAFLDWLERGAASANVPVAEAATEWAAPQGSERQRGGLAIYPVSRQLVRHLLNELPQTFSPAKTWP